MRALRASWGITRPEYRGPHYAFGDVVVEPTSPRRDVPIWVGGQGARSLRRAVELGDGWAPFGLKPAAAQALLADAGSPALDVALQPPRPVDPIGDAGRAADTLTELEQASATHATLRFVHHSARHYVEQLEALIALRR